jgi:gamma-glutamyltranspeptidase/glutathione hydrolase
MRIPTPAALSLAAALTGTSLLLAQPALTPKPAATAKPAAAAKPQAAKGPRAGVASESRLCSETALSVLRAGGTAADAVIAASLVAGVVSPSSSGLGGGGFALYYRASDKSSTVLDFRESAPAKLDLDAFERRPLPDAERGKVVGVPGEVAGLAELHRRFGKRPWRELVAPAERFARNGFPVEEHLAGMFNDRFSPQFRRMPSVDETFFPKGKAAIVGQRVKRPKLGRTLAKLGAEGPRAFYEGPIADDIVSAAQKFGGTLTREDLKNYRVRERAPLKVNWEGYEVVTMPPPSAGGVLLAEVLGSFSRDEISRTGLRSGLGVHLVSEVMRGALADRACCVGDPDVLPIDTARLLLRERLAARKAKISADKTSPIKRFLPEEKGTHALVVADAEGNIVSLTTTVNSPFGADIEGAESGVVLNDELEDFTALKASTEFGVRFPPNRARPLLRPVSSMTPTIVLRDGSPVLALGGSGGSRIAPNVTLVLLSTLAAGEPPEAALKAPRYRPQPGEFSLALDPGFSEADIADLTRRGETVKPNDPWGGAVQLLAFGENGVTGAADQRKHGSALFR